MQSRNREERVREPGFRATEGSGARRADAHGKLEQDSGEVVYDAWDVVLLRREPLTLAVGATSTLAARLKELGCGVANVAVSTTAPVPDMYLSM